MQAVMCRNALAPQSDGSTGFGLDFGASGLSRALKPKA